MQRHSVSIWGHRAWVRPASANCNIDQANALLGALEEPGPGTLIHPWFGTLTVSIKDTARVSFDAALGQARFSMSFVESGELEFPSSETSTQAASRIAASDLEKASS